MDELEIKGKKYISSKRAAQLTGYTKDYIGQLSRSQKIQATRVGRAWYVEIEALLAHKKSESRAQNSEPGLQSDAFSYSTQIPVQMPGFHPTRYLPKAFPNTWGEIRYLPDDSDLIPMPSKALEAFEPQKQTFIRMGQPKKATEPDTNPVRLQILRQKMTFNREVSTKKGSVAKRALQIRAKRKNIDSSLSFAALTAALAIFLFFFAGFFVSSDISFTSPNQAYTANIIVGLQYVTDAIKQYPLFNQAFELMGGFFNLLLSSFSNFLSIGFNFLVSIASLLFVR